jgi:Alpha-glucosidases, family 31 of glycosyl hydrolases
MAFILDPIAQWGLRHFFIKYPQKRSRQLASLGRRLGEEPRLEKLRAVSFEGRSGPELRFRSKGDGDAAHLPVSVSVTPLEEGIVRVAALVEGRPRLTRTWAVCGRPGETPLEGRLRDDYSVFSCPPYELEARSDLVVARTAELRIEIGLDPFRITWRSVGDDKAVASDSVVAGGGYILAEDSSEGGLALEPARPDGRPGRALRHSMAKTSDRFYGFGEKSGKLNKDGRRLVMMDCDCMGYDARVNDPLYKHFPCYIALGDTGSRAWGLFYDNFAVSEFDLGRADKNRVTWTADAGELDYYFVYGPSARQVLRRFALLSGRPALPPRWSLGYGGSTMGYTEASDAQARLERFLGLCEEKDFPCDLFHLSSGYTTGRDGKRYVFEWNSERVPDPEGLFERYANQSVHVSANVKPALLTTHPRYAEVEAMGGFVRGPEGKSFVAPFWGGVGSFLDFTHPAARDWWKSRMKESLLRRGVDSSWNDNNEFEAWDEDCSCEAFGERRSIDQMRPLLSYHMVRASAQAQAECRPESRPFLLTRAACPGSQRYAQTWTGDNYASWRNMKWNIPMGLGLALSGMPSFGHDTGGFSGFRIGGELFARWVQATALNPRFCIHSWHFDGSVNEPWMSEKAAPAVRAAFELRYRLLPYLYSLFAQAAASGDPIVAPLAYYFQEDEEAAEDSFDFMVGPFLLAAPVLRKLARHRDIRLPGGGQWFDFYSGRPVEPASRDGRRARLAARPVTRLAASLERLPLLAAAGAIVPMGRANRRANEHPDATRELRLFPAAGEMTSEFGLYEDDGESMAYARGERLELLVRLRSSREGLELSIEASGSYRPDYDELELVLPPGEERPLSYRGALVDFVTEAAANAEGWRRGAVRLSF